MLFAGLLAVLLMGGLAASLALDLDPVDDDRNEDGDTGGSQSSTDLTGGEDESDPLPDLLLWPDDADPLTDAPAEPEETGSPGAEDAPAETGESEGIYRRFPDADDPWIDDAVESPSTDAPTEATDILANLGDEGGYLAGGPGHDTLAGGTGDDMIHGGDGNDLLSGGDGDDTLRGGNGDDTILGGEGDDQLFGGEGNDLLVGGGGDDLLVGGGGDDTLIGGEGHDTLKGGEGNDLLVAGPGSNLLFGGDGNDTLVGAIDGPRPEGEQSFLNGGAGDDLLVLGAGDVAHGGPGADSFALGQWLIGNGMAEVTDFNPAEDRLVLSFDPADGPAPETITLSEDPEQEGRVLVLFDDVPVARIGSANALLSPEQITIVTEVLPNLPGRAA